MTPLSSSFQFRIASLPFRISLLFCVSLLFCISLPLTASTYYRIYLLLLLLIIASTDHRFNASLRQQFTVSVFSKSLTSTWTPSH